MCGREIKTLDPSQILATVPDLTRIVEELVVECPRSLTGKRRGLSWPTEKKTRPELGVPCCSPSRVRHSSGTHGDGLTMRKGIAHSLHLHLHRQPVAYLYPRCLTVMRMKRQAQPETIEVKLSKALSYVLRHHPPPGTMDKSGWMPVPVLLQHLKVKTDLETLRAVVANNDKVCVGVCSLCLPCPLLVLRFVHPQKRFVLDESTVPPRIRAAQGHSVALEEPVLDDVTDAATVPVALHVTSREGYATPNCLLAQLLACTLPTTAGVHRWEAIQKSGELSRMKRTHIHFATLPGHLRQNQWATVHLQLNLEVGRQPCLATSFPPHTGWLHLVCAQGALSAGHKFHKSSNSVLLCEGPLPAHFVKCVSLEDLPDEWSAAGRAAPTAEATAAVTQRQR